MWAHLNEKRPRTTNAKIEYVLSLRLKLIMVNYNAQLINSCYTKKHWYDYRTRELQK